MGKKMELQSGFIFLSSLFMGSLLTIILLALKRAKQKRRSEEQGTGATHLKTLPGPRNLPIIGSLHHLARRQMPFHTFRDLSAIYGPIMRIKLGEIDAVVVSSVEAAEEVMRTRDAAFASRPVSSSVYVLFYRGCDIGFSPYGKLWKQMRRICALELLSTKRVCSFRGAREEELSFLLQRVASSSGSEVNIGELFFESTNNIITKISIGGTTSDDQKTFMSMIGDVSEFMSGFRIADLFPSISFLGRITGFQKKLEECHKNMDLIVEKIFHEHKEKRDKFLSNGDGKLMEEKDLIDVLLRIQCENNLQVPLSNDNIKAMIIDMILAGSETTASTMEWAMAEMIRNPNTMKKAQKEIREAIDSSVQIGQVKLVDEEQLLINHSRITYLPLIIKETLRLHHPPMLLPRLNQEASEIMGYFIPAKTSVWVNMWAISRDEKYWDDPNSFRPERFEKSSLDFKGTQFHYIPFGAGRRVCPGMQFALAFLEVALIYLLYYFDWEFVGHNGEKELDMREALGATARRMSPVVLVPTLHYPIPL